MWRKLRIAALLLVLAAVATEAWFDHSRSRSWQHPLWVGIYPVDGDSSPVTAAYVAELTRADFVPIEAFFAREARRYGIAVDPPVHVELYPCVTDPPPVLALHAGTFARIAWSLKLRWYAARHAAGGGLPAPQIRIFVLFHDPSRAPRVPHSLAVQKGQVGVVHAFAADEMTGSNDVVIAHETLHTLDATDKYDGATDEPVYPDGYGDPVREPRFPQDTAEIMAGRRAISPHEQETPDSLRSVVIGARTAREIGWTAH